MAVCWAYSWASRWSASLKWSTTSPYVCLSIGSNRGKCNPSNKLKRWAKVFNELNAYFKHFHSIISDLSARFSRNRQGLLYKLKCARTTIFHRAKASLDWKVLNMFSNLLGVRPEHSGKVSKTVKKENSWKIRLRSHEIFLNLFQSFLFNGFTFFLIVSWICIIIVYHHPPRNISFRHHSPKMFPSSGLKLLQPVAYRQSEIFFGTMTEWGIFRGPILTKCCYLQSFLDDCSRCIDCFLRRCNAEYLDKLAWESGDCVIWR